MPFYHFYDETSEDVELEEVGEGLDSEGEGERDPDRFTYEAAEAKFDRATFEKPTQAVLDYLREMGATHFYVRYDGGSDEGFAYPEYLTFHGMERSAKEVAEELARSPALQRIQDAAAPVRHHPYLNRTPEQNATLAIDSLAEALASSLLGDGYGTGEYELYGALTANLITGEIVDDSEAKPGEMR